MKYFKIEYGSDGAHVLPWWRPKRKRKIFVVLFPAGDRGGGGVKGGGTGRRSWGFKRVAKPRQIP